MGVFGLLLETRRATSLLLLIIFPTIYSGMGVAKADSVIATGCFNLC
jgi:hypothetical protein